MKSQLRPTMMGKLSDLEKKDRNRGHTWVERTRNSLLICLVLFHKIRVSLQKGSAHRRKKKSQTIMVNLAL